MTRNLQSIVSMLVLAFVATASFAASTPAINVDFNSHDPGDAHPPAGTYVGVGADPDPGTFWNGVDINTGAFTTTTFTSGNLTASDGSTLTGVKFTLTEYGPQNQQGSYGNPDGVAIATDLFGDDVYNSASPTVPTYTITGLDPTIRYNLYLYSLGFYPNSNNTVFTVDGVSGSTTITGDPTANGLPGGPPVTSFESVAAGTSGIGNYVLYSHVTATGGVISGTFAGSNSRFNGFQLVEAPEPASLGLLVVGGVMLLRRRRA